MADFFFLTQCPFVWQLCPNQQLSVNPLERPSPAQLPEYPAPWRHGSVFTWQSPAPCASEFQTSALFFKPALSLTFWFDPQSIPSHQFTPMTVSASCLVITVMPLKLTWSLVLWYLATSRWPQRKKVISQRVICFHTVDFSRSHTFGITYSFRKHTEHLLLWDSQCWSYNKQGIVPFGFLPRALIYYWCTTEGSCLSDSSKPNHDNKAK